MEALARGEIDTTLVDEPPKARDAGARGPRRVRADKDTWPDTGSSLCWHCCHAYAGQFLPMPVRYDARSDAYDVVGAFCSWACMKAYNLDSRSYLAHINMMLITAFRKRVTGTLGGVRAAPPRLALRAFGGPLDIEEFRRNERNVGIVPPPMILHVPTVGELPSSQRRRPTRDQLNESVSFKDATAQNDMLKLRRPKPLQGDKNLLMRAIGVQIRAA